MYVTVRAPLLASRQTGPLLPGPNPNEIGLVAGATVSGKVIKNGKPIRGVTLALRQNVIEDADKGRDRAGIPLEFHIDTDAQGIFRFVNVPPEESWVLYFLMDSFQSHGALKLRRVSVGRNKTTCDVGLLMVEPGHRLSGRVILADGKPLPGGTKVYIARREEGVFDSQIAATAADGSFAFRGLPAEQFELTTRVPGYRVSSANYSHDVFQGRGLYGIVNDDIDGLRFLLEPGAFVQRKLARAEMEEGFRRRLSPLQGAPADPPANKRALPHPLRP